MNIGALVPMVLVLFIYGGLVAAAVYLFVLLSRLAKAQERTAGALEDIARKLRDDTKP